MLRPAIRSRHVLLATVATLAALRAQGTPIDFAETFALAPDRAAAVATLIPGSDDWYYWHCRERLDARDFATVRRVLPTWTQRHGHSERVIEIENREALLSYGDQPQRTFDFLRDRLGLRFDHQRVDPTAKSDLPTRLDASVVSTRTLLQQALARTDANLDAFTDAALPALATEPLSPRQLRALLSRLRRPDVANLPALVVRDLEERGSGGFGSHEVHRMLRLEQLEECARLRPSLLQQPRFVEAWLVRLQPDADADTADPAVRLAHLQRLWQFAQRLPSSFNSLKAHVLYWWLRLDLEQGAADKERFLAYLRLPRRGGFASEAHLRRFGRGDEHVDLAARYPTDLPAIGDDTALVRAYLERFFATEDAVEAYAEWLDAGWLETVLAETKLLLGQGDPERWYALLRDPARLEQLKQRVEITFPPELRTRFGAGDRVVLAVDTKNVPTLLVKVYAIDAFRYHVERQREVDASIDLDGVVANHEQTLTFAEPPLRRVRRTLDLPMLSTPGTWVVELVGNGISSRAVIHKGSLRVAERTSAGGHLVRVHDESGAALPGASVWFGGREYGPNERGEVLLPFSTDPGAKLLVLRAGDRSSLVRFQHRAETYRLVASPFVDRESLVAGATARLAVRVQLRLGERDIALQLLQQRVLTIVATDLDGLATTTEVRDPALVDERELVHELQVPQRLQSLQVSLRGAVKDLAGNDVALASASRAFAVNGIDATPQTGATLLLRTRAGYVVDVRGKNGEPLAGRACGLRLTLRDYREPLHVTLQSDANGRIELGELPGVAAIQVTPAGGAGGDFVLRGDTARWPEALHGRAGETLRVPYTGTAREATRAELGLLGHRHDAFGNLAIADGFVELRDLPPGDYTLHDHRSGVTVPVRVTAGERDGPWLVGRVRTLRASPTAPLQVRSVELQGDRLEVHVANATPGTRLHVVATRALPAFDPFSHLAGAEPRHPGVFVADHADSTYHNGRKLADEYRYVLERRFAPKLAGNMLARPSLLLNPWAIDDSWNAAVGIGGGTTGRYGGRGGAKAGAAEPVGNAQGEGAEAGGGAFANVDYLPRGSVFVPNLVPDERGVVRVPLADLGDGQQIHVVALDGDQAIRRQLVRDEAPLAPRARTLPRALDTARHFVEQRRIEFVAAGATATLADARVAQVEVLDSLAAVHRLLLTIRRDDADLAKFAFVVDWPAKSAEEKQQLYREHACHELHFFLYQKDRAFFDAVVRPFLAQKLDPKFLDHWLLGANLTAYTRPWEFAQLNLIERILLAQRLDEQGRTAIARSVREALELRPVDVVALGRLFDLALKSDELATARTGSDDFFLGATRKATDPQAGAPGAPPAAAPAPPETGGPVDKAKEAARAESKDRRRDAGEELGKKAEQLADDVQERADEKRLRGQVQNLFRAVARTKVLVEHDWWHRRIEQTTPDVVAPNRFWIDYANAPAGQPFASSAIVEASTSFLEAMMALSVVDLPFTAGKHELVADGDQRTLRAATPLLLVRKEVTASERAPDQAPLLLGQNFYRLDDRWRFENGERRDAFVTEEFLVGVAYGCQVVVTNPTSSPRVAEVLLQVPAGAVPVQRGFWTKGVPVRLEPYATATLEYAFYFPATGGFAHYPAHAAEKGRLAAFAEPRTLNVVAAPTKVDTTSWEHVSQQGSAAEVLTFLDTHNVQGIELAKVAWRLRERELFTQLLGKLRARHVYDHVLWSYGVLHRDPQATKEFLQHAQDFVQQIGMAIDSPLLTIDPKERRAFQHVEFDPLVHPRAHRLGGQRVLGNATLAAQYRATTMLLGYHPKLDAEDWLVVTYYLALQDRIEEALAAFAKVDGAAVATVVQYDYLAAWLSFFTGDTQRARTLAERHRDDPVLHWQQRFREVLRHLDEAEGRVAAPGEGAPDAAATAPALELAIADRAVVVSHRNLARCEVRYYELDVEFAFSAQPFAATGGTSAAFVQPALVEQKELPAAEVQTAFPLPERFVRRNVLVEVRGGGLVRSRQYFANALDARFLESFGQVAVYAPDTKAPLPKTYVKVFAKLADGTVRFHKDGYTDLRGRFDYASLSDDPNANAQRYAVLVLDEQRGAVIREVAPPAK
jgi:hypothetical protein